MQIAPVAIANKQSFSLQIAGITLTSIVNVTSFYLLPLLSLPISSPINKSSFRLQV
jgi:hypothetical protein